MIENNLEKRKNELRISVKIKAKEFRRFVGLAKLHFLKIGIAKAPHADPDRAIGQIAAGVLWRRRFESRRLHFEREKGHIDILFANAGGAEFAPLGEITSRLPVGEFFCGMATSSWPLSLHTGGHTRNGTRPAPGAANT